MNRRTFVNRTGAMVALGITGAPAFSFTNSNRSTMKKIKISRVNANFEREPLTPYHFKGSAITECWQSIARIDSDTGAHAVGLGTQSVLWSDASIFANTSESGGNALMFAMTEQALDMIRGTTFEDPIALLDELFPEILEYGKKITGNPNLRKTFALNPLVSVDNAAWLLYAKENNISTFDDLIPARYKPGLSYHHQKVASIPSFSTGAAIDTIKAAAAEGYFMLKLKIGAAGTQSEMLQKDMEFITAVHKTLGSLETPYTDNGKIPYYFDANERYEKKEDLLKLLDHAKKIGAFSQIAVVEEPFSEDNEVYVGDMGVRVAADESAHTVEDAERRIEQGYSAIAVKAIAKTLSMTMKITQLAYEKNVPCFCADLTVNPILVEWNKSVAARLKPFPGMHIGLLETNGHQYYKQWETMRTYHPMPNAPWANAKDGVFNTDESFYKESGGIFVPSPHYEGLVG